ncbi:MAG TPA: ABC transporter permease, partial [Candidatus Thermoplasmatota archaeon]|nr:ABC transporter permease [Candidatus Thermoplasmatota archaeon]
MSALLPLLAKDARLLLRNRALLAALLLYPVLLAVALAAAFQEPPATLDVAVFNGDEGGSHVELGGERIDAGTLVAHASAYARVRNVTSEEAALAAVRRGEADAALLIPEGFMQRLATLGGNATLRVVVDESDPVRAGVARSAVTGGVDAFLRMVVQRKVADVESLLNLTVTGGTTRFLFVEVDVMGIDRARAALAEVHRTLDPRSAEARKVDDVIAFLDFARGVLGNAGTILRTTALPVDVQAEGLAARATPLSAVALPGALVLGVFWTGALAAAILAARERETGVARRLAAAPGARVASAVSKALAALLAALVPALLLLLLAVVAAQAVVRDAARRSRRSAG